MQLSSKLKTLHLAPVIHNILPPSQICYLFVFPPKLASLNTTEMLCLLRKQNIFVIVTYDTLKKAQREME